MDQGCAATWNCQTCIMGEANARASCLLEKHSTSAGVVVTLGERGSRCGILNGAAARTCQLDDQLIVCNSLYLGDDKLTSLRPRILTFDEDIIVRDRLQLFSELGSRRPLYSRVLMGIARHSPCRLWFQASTRWKCDLASCSGSARRNLRIGGMMRLAMLGPA